MHKKKPHDLELYKRTDEVLFYIWDPIGVSGTPEARDEYESYLPVVFSMLKQSKTIDEIADYLGKIEIENMGLGEASGLRSKNIKVAKLLNDHKEWIEEKFNKA